MFSKISEGSNYPVCLPWVCAGLRNTRCLNRALELAPLTGTKRTQSARLCAARFAQQHNKIVVRSRLLQLAVDRFKALLFPRALMQLLHQLHRLLLDLLKFSR